MSTALIGKWGEAQAAAYLRKKGYQISDVNYRTRYGEIDMIARNRKILAFVEVKLRKNASFAHAMEFVDLRKQKKIKLAAESYLQSSDGKLQPRFDVIEIYAPDGISDTYTINHIENAFE